MAQRAFDIDLLPTPPAARDRSGRALVLDLLPEIMAPHVRNADPG